jgi:predicted enzyme related to lactoylglutathione lyase
MPEMTSYRAGSFCWADLATNDTQGAKSFYAGLFGWESLDMPTDAGIPYTMFLAHGRQVCALYSMGPDQDDARPHWQSYVAVEDADRTAAVVSDCGGNILMPPMDVMDAGRMSMIQDPTGAVLGLWQPNRHQGAQLWNQSGAICWNELLTRDPDRAERFLGDLFGWSSKTNPNLMEGKYRVLHHDGEQVGGLLGIEPEWGEMRSNWTVYFGVDDCDGTIAEVERRGGNLLFPAMEIADVGRFAYLQDPQGALFAIIRHSRGDS